MPGQRRQGKTGTAKRSEFPFEVKEEGEAFRIEKVVVCLEVGVVDGDEWNETTVKNRFFRLKLLVIKLAFFYELYP
jgi:hypothetical protein